MASAYAHVLRVPPSYSSIGRMYDAASKPDDGTKVLKIRPKVVIEPWEGLELIEEVLHEAEATSKGVRGQPLVSSPRVNPAMVQKEVCETSASLEATFLTATGALEIPEVASQLHGVPPKEADFPQQSRSLSRTRRPDKSQASSVFLAPPRPSPGDELLGRGPDVGQYCPKYGVIERHAGSVKIHRVKHRPKKHRVQHPDFEVSQKEMSRTQQSLEASVVLNQSLVGSVRTAVPEKAAKKLAPGEYRVHDIQDVSSVFKSRVPRSPVGKEAGADCWPYPMPGTTTYSRGAWRGCGRKRPPEGGKPCGPNIFYYPPDPHRPQSSLAFSQSISRDKQITRQTMHSGIPPQSYAYRVNIDTLSTKSRVHTPIPFAKQVVRPLPRQATPGDGLGPEVGSVTTIRKPGFVDLRRMLSKQKDDIFAEDPNEHPPQSALQVSRAQVERKSPAYKFDTSSPRKKENAERAVPQYHPNIEAVKPHRPVCTFSPSRDRSRESPVNASEPIPMERAESPILRSKLVSPNMSLQISREQRDKKDQKRLNVDAFYELPQLQPKGIVPFGVTTGRRTQ